MRTLDKEKEMLKKVSDLAENWRCDHPEHMPPTMIALSPGTYEHTCPKCKLVITFIVRDKGSL
jgi:hypothetical protein